MNVYVASARLIKCLRLEASIAYQVQSMAESDWNLLELIYSVL
jgi:hypothetical protein